MLFHEFPDLGWLKSQTAQRFSNRMGWGGLRLETDGFPSVIINTSTRNAFRPDITGPLSVFLNIKGESRAETDGRSLLVKQGFYFISNRFQPYSLEIDSAAPTETFNIHFGEYFSGSVLQGLITPADKLLNNEQRQPVASVDFYNKLYRCDDRFNYLVRQLYTSHRERFDKLLFEEQLAALLAYLLGQHRHILQAVEKLPPVKQSTRIELYRRLSYALDYIHSGSTTDISLDTLASAACLSKYHFLRLFKLAYGLSPHQYLQQCRLQKARELLAHSSLPVHEIATELGFEAGASFSRLFFRQTGMYPSQYRSPGK